MTRPLATPRHLAVMLAALSMAACNGGGSSSGSSDTPATGVTLSGQASVNGASVVSVGFGSRVAAASVQASALNVHAAALEPIAGADVALYKIYPDGVEEPVDIGSVTTDAVGNYSIPNVPVAETGSGATTDFYYEVRISDAAGTDVRAPVAPAADTVVDVTPATNLAARILSDVAEVPGQDNLPTPSAELIESVRTLVAEDVDTLETDGAITVPDATIAGEAEVLASANGLASAGSDAEKLYKAVQFESELLALEADAGATAADAGAYIKRVTREGTDQRSTGNALPAIAADAMGQALIDGMTFTPTEIVAAYNANNGFDPDVVLADKVEQFSELLGGVEDKFGDAIGAPEDMEGDSQVALYTKRDLVGTAFAADTPLAPDQAVAFLQTLPFDAANPATDVGGFGNNVDVTGIVADLTDAAALANPAIADVQIYHNSGFGCGAGLGHFMADVDVYAPGLAVTGVTVTSTDAAALGGDGTESLAPSGNRWASNTNGVCVDLGTPVTYTVEATLSNASTVSTTVQRNHPSVAEASTTVDGAATSNDANNPDILTVKRPLYTWQSPDAMLAAIVDAPAGSQVKYTYEFSHVAVAGPLAGAPLNANTYPGCNSVNSSGSLAMYSVDSFVPTVDCDIAACAASTGEPESNIICRMNIQTFLVDGYDRLLGQAAGHFPVFCVDTNEDGDCGG